MIGYIILVLVAVALAFALYSQRKSAKQHVEKGEQLLKDYQKRVNEMERLLSDYRALEQNFDNVGQGYEHALLAFDKMEEDKQKMQNIVDTLRKQNEELQQNSSQISSSLLQKNQIIEKAALEAKKQIVANPSEALKQLNNILNANDIDMDTPIEADDNIVVSQLIEKAVNESGIKAANYLTFIEEVSEVVKSTMLLTNEPQLVRALSILLDNAAKFTTEGSVKLSASSDDKNIRFTVEDSGSGIPAEEAEHIFEPFVKLNNYFDGDGIGLTAARSIAHRLKGDLILDTEYAGPGARFVLSIPI